MKIYSEKLEEIRERVESMAIENDYARKNLEFELVVGYVFELEQRLEIEKEHTREWKRIAQKNIKR